MEPRFVDIFVEALRTVFESMGAAPVTVVGRITEPHHPVWGEIGAVVSLKGSSTEGALLLALDAPAACALASTLLCEEFKELNDDARSVVGEVTNMVCGDAKRRLSESGVVVGMALPQVLKPGLGALPPRASHDGVVVVTGTVPGGAFTLSIDFVVSPQTP